MEVGRAQLVVEEWGGGGGEGMLQLRSYYTLQAPGLRSLLLQYLATIIIRSQSRPGLF